MTDSDIQLPRDAIAIHFLSEADCERAKGTISRNFPNETLRDMGNKGFIVFFHEGSRTRLSQIEKVLESAGLKSLILRDATIRFQSSKHFERAFNICRDFPEVSFSMYGHLTISITAKAVSIFDQEGVEFTSDPDAIDRDTHTMDGSLYRFRQQGGGRDGR